MHHPNSPVSLNGTNSTGAITSFSWLQLAGTPVILVEANTATPSFGSPSAPTSLSFELTVDGEGGPSTDTVNVEVIGSAPIPIANAGANQKPPRQKIPGIEIARAHNSGRQRPV